MFLINIVDIFSKVTIIQYVFVAFGFFGINLCIKKLVLNK